jgi:hypothetical protein
MLRGNSVTTRDEWWQVFFYRFVNPDSRRGPNLNYAARLTTARAVVMPPWVIYYCPPPPSVPPAAVKVQQ